MAKSEIINKAIEKYKNLPMGTKAAVAYTFANLMQKAINVLVVPLYTRLLTTAEYGTYSVFISWMELFEIVVTFRLFYGAYVVGLVKFEDDRECYTSSLETLSAIITTVFLLIYIVFQNPINNLTDLTTALTLLMFLMMYAIPVVGFWKAWERVDNKYVSVVILTFALSFFTPLFGILGIRLMANKANAIVYARVGIEIAIAIFILIRFKRRFFEKNKLRYWKYALKMNVPLLPYYLSTIVLNHSDRIVIQKMVGYSEAGIYSVAYSAAMIMTLFNTSFNSSLQPWLFKQLKKKNYSDIHKTLNFVLLLVAGVNILLIAVAPEVVTILAPEQYHEAIYIIPPLATSVYVMAFYQNFVNVEFYYSESKITAVASIGAAVLNIILNIAFIPRFGYLAAGYTTLVSYLIFLGAHYFFAKKVCQKNKCPFSIFDMKTMGKISIFFVGTSIVLTLVYQTKLLRYALIIGFLVIVVLNRNEMKTRVSGFLKEKKN